MPRECWGLSELGTCQEGPGWPLSPLQTESSCRKALGVTSTVLTYSKARGALAEEVGSHHFLWEGESLQPPSCCPPSSDAPPSSSATTHSGKSASRALAALPPGNYTLGANLLPFRGRPGERVRRVRKGEAAMKRHWGKAAFADDYRGLPPEKHIVFISTW